LVSLRHSYLGSSLGPEDVGKWEPSGTLLKEQGSCNLVQIWGTKGLS
jgi:hypothetical protein